MLKTPARRQLAELAEGPHRHDSAAEWQADLLADREAQKPALVLMCGWNKTGAGEAKAHLASRR